MPTAGTLQCCQFSLQLRQSCNVDMLEDILAEDRQIESVDPQASAIESTNSNNRPPNYDNEEQRPVVNSPFSERHNTTFVAVLRFAFRFPSSQAPP